MATLKPYFFAMISFAAIGACGGSTSDQNSGGTSSGGSSSGGKSSGGTTSSGGTSTGGTSTGGTSTGGSSTGGCGGGGAADCVDCKGYSSPICVNGQWTCEQHDCSDSGAGGACPANQVPTIDGCLTCDAATQAYTSAIDAAQKANSACNLETDCVLTAASTTCSGSCQIAVSKSGEAAFQAELASIDKNYCSGFVAVCGYSTPKCANATLACNAGTCEAIFK